MFDDALTANTAFSGCCITMNVAVAAVIDICLGIHTGIAAGHLVAFACQNFVFYARTGFANFAVFKIARRVAVTAMRDVRLKINAGLATQDFAVFAFLLHGVVLGDALLASFAATSRCQA